MADAARLKSAVYRATQDTAGDGEGDPAAMIEVDGILKEHPELIAEGVKYIKARIKDRSIAVAVISLHLIDQCMQSNGFQFQVHVIKKVLQRVLKFAYLNKGTPPVVQQLSASLIRQWASTYGTDARMSEFAAAARELAKQEEKSMRAGVMSPQMNAITTRGALASPQQAQMARNMGSPPGGGMYQQQLPPFASLADDGMQQHPMAGGGGGGSTREWCRLWILTKQRRTCSS